MVRRPKEEMERLKQRAYQLSLAGMSGTVIARELGIDQHTYWRWRREWEEKLEGEFLQKKWRMVCQWYARHQYAYRHMHAAYARSEKFAEEDAALPPELRKGLEPNYTILLRMTKLEDSVLDRLLKMKLLTPTEVRALFPRKNPNGLDIGESLLEAAKYRRQQEAKRREDAKPPAAEPAVEPHTCDEPKLIYPSSA